MRKIKLRSKNNYDITTIKDEISYRKDLRKLLPNYKPDNFFRCLWKLLDYLNN